MPLTDQRVVVLGGTSGIGLATGLQAAGLGARIVVVSRSAARVRAALEALPEGCTGGTADLDDDAQVSALFERIGPFDHLVYTAGEPLRMMPIDQMDVAAARDFFGLRYFGALRALGAARPYLRATGSVVLTSGTAAERAGPGWVVGASVCGAVESMVRTAAVELAPIRVNAVRPGVVRSPVWARLPEAEREGMYRQIAEANPLGRVGEVEDVAEAYVYLLRQGYTTGTVLTVDGGSLLA
ncbi:short-chain dehydrogenase [Streptomyces sulfonofaciens]|uniref:Short-chain dehydrogenase n=2 Tax=Streptomyces sulfonofaciens TaxID=68272 RepID=A0A919L6R4_9ACTN|nr:short-chain dehydrogenase [Streptomyces sulfonofaciens]